MTCGPREFLDSSPLSLREIIGVETEFGFTVPDHWIRM